MQDLEDFKDDLRAVRSDAIGGEPLDGSGFEVQEPTPGFVFSDMDGEQ